MTIHKSFEKAQERKEQFGGILDITIEARGENIKDWSQSGQMSPVFQNEKLC